MSGDQLFKQFIDRILRCREAEDEAKEDTKAVYAELKAAGFDKTIAGKFVNELRQKEKNPDKFSETDTILDLYREAYERASHTHAREADQSKGEINGPEVEPTASSFDEIAETNSNSSEPSPEAETDKAGTEPPPFVPAAPIEDDFEPPTFLRKDERNERCMQPASCKFARHPQKITCSECATAWQISQRKAARQSEVA